MKILYVAHQRGNVDLASRALNGTVPNVTVTWSQTLGSGIEWLQANSDAAAVIVDADVQGQSCASFLEQVRGLGLTTPVVVVLASAELEPALAALNAGADGYVVAGPSLHADLSRIVALATDRERSRARVFLKELSELAAALDGAEQRLERAEETRQQAQQQSASELAAVAARLADAQVRQSASLAREARICTALQQRLFELEGELRNVEEKRASEAAASADQLAKRHVEFTAGLTQTARSREALATELTAATVALEEAQQARRADAAAAGEHLRRRESELGAALADAVAVRATLEGALAEADAAHCDAQQRSEADLLAANERQAALEDLLAQEADRRAILERKLAAGEAAQQEADRRHTTELTMAAVQLADVQARYDAALAEHAAARAALEHDLAGVRTASDSGRRRFLHVVSAHRRRTRELRARLETQLSDERADADGKLRAKDEETQQILLERETLRSQVGTTQDQLLRLQATVDEERQAYERARLTSELELERMSAAHGQLRQSFDQLQAAFQTLEQIAGDHAAERARLESVVGDRDSQLTVQAERHRVAEQTAQDAIAHLQEQGRQALEASASEIDRLQREIDALGREADVLRANAGALRGAAERVPDLESQIEASQKERRRLFERAPYGLCRCTSTGVITEANHSFVTLLGRRRAEELRGVDFAAAVADCAGDLGWLLERTRTVRKTEPIETNWKTKDGRPLIVRLHGLATTTGSVEIVVEDITSVRALEERLRQAQRMEAVGRLASEVAVTCDALLRDVARETHEWLDAIGSEDALRRRGERLLTDLTRAASFLRQLGVYGNTQVRALEPVSVPRVLRDLSPVLKRVVGDRIELVLPKTAGAFEVDVEAERVERVLVNVAGYARERMPDGGQVTIDLATIAVGRRFIAKYPNVRPGAHVLITVTELPRAGESRGEPERRSVSSDKPGLDLGALGELIGTCGGHMWMEAQPAGNMVVKVHLPKPAGDRATDTSGPDVPSDRGGRLARWFRLAPPAGVRARIETPRRSYTATFASPEPPSTARCFVLPL